MLNLSPPLAVLAAATLLRIADDEETRETKA
jgi:hypothetical protein